MTLTGCQVAGSSESPSRRNHTGERIREQCVEVCDFVTFAVAWTLVDVARSTSARIAV
jgi:hypothetical protein